MIQRVERTVPYRNYISPSNSMIGSVAEKLGFKGTLSCELVRDIANSMSFPELEREECYTDPASWIITSDKKDLGEQQSEIASTFSYHRKVQNFVRSLDVEGFSGETPLEKAINIVAALSSQRGGKPRKGSSDPDKEPPIPIFQEQDTQVQKLAKTLKEATYLTEKIKPGTFMEKALKVNAGEGVLGGITAADLGPEKMEILRKIAIFKANGKIAATKKVTITEDAHAKEKRNLMMTNYSEISKVSPIHSALPNFDYKFATKQLTLDKGVKVDEAKQCLILLIDDSGSMNCDDKISWLKALLINRCEEVVSGNAELYICTFEVELDRDWIVIRTADEAKNVWEKFSTYFRLGRGGTDMQRAITKATELIKSGEVPTKGGSVKISSIRPQIVIINDGQDHIDDHWLPKIETHGFILEGSHMGMKKFCERSGGSYTEFHH